MGIEASFRIGFGLGTVGIPASFKIGGGLGTVGIAEFATGSVVGAATACTADRARAEPRATHETFNHDEVIWNTPQRVQRNLLERLT